MRGLQFASWLAAAVAAIGLTFALSASPAAADDGARAFTQTLIDKGFGILRDTRMDKASRVAGFNAFVVQHMDARKTALFTLGNYRRGAPDGVVEPFVEAFTAYSTAIYGAHLVDYAASTLRVTGDVTNKPGDVTVMTLAEGGTLREPLRIAFRLAADGALQNHRRTGRGIWLSVEQREQFASVLAQNRGDIASLTASLKDRASAPAPAASLRGRPPRSFLPGTRASCRPSNINAQRRRSKSGLEAQPVPEGRNILLNAGQMFYICSFGFRPPIRGHDGYCDLIRSRVSTKAVATESAMCAPPCARATNPP
jgi:phospholipid transport system substrate-binding protein